MCFRKALQGTRLPWKETFFVDTSIRKYFFTQASDTSRHTHGPALFLRHVSYTRAGFPTTHATRAMVAHIPEDYDFEAGFSCRAL